MTEKIVVTKPEEYSGVYTIINPIEKKAYIGETNDQYRRLVEHIRSMFGMEESSNEDLIADVKNKAISDTYELFPLCYAEYKKRQGRETNRQWIKDETIYMYLFRIHGFSLYNKKVDNTGKSREFLMDMEIEKSQLHGKLLDFLGEWNNCCEKCNDWNEYIKLAEKELDKDFRIRFGKKLDEFECLEKSERIELWENHLKKTKEYKAYLFDTNMDRKKINRLCSELSVAALNKKDMEGCGIKGIEADKLKELARTGLLDNIAICSFGGYLAQTPMTILSTKKYDIDHNTMKVDADNKIIITNRINKNEPGICFWAFSRSKTDYREELEKYSCDKKERYLIMPYTSSLKYAKDTESKEEAENNYKEFNPEEGEAIKEFFKRMRTCYEERKCGTLECMKEEDSLESRMKIDKFAFGYGFDRRAIDNKSGQKFEYPSTMFPEIVSKWSISENGTIRNSANVAFLISEIEYIDANIDDIDKLNPYFRTHTGNTLTDTLSKSPNTRCCAKLEDLEGFIDFLEKNNSMLGDKDSIKFLLAKLEYPYVVALANDPIDY